MEQFVDWLNSIIWSQYLVYLCLATGLFYSLLTRFLQVRHMKEMIKQMFQGKSSEAGISSFQALSLALSGRVGTGNIAGVATAIAYGGPGAVFWMWLIAFVGAGSAFVEAALAQVYKTKQDGQFRGGPAYYIEKGLKMKWYADCLLLLRCWRPGCCCRVCKPTALPREWKTRLASVRRLQESELPFF